MFEFLRGSVSDSGMRSDSVIKDLDIFEDCGCRLLSAGKVRKFDKFAFDCTEEALGGCVVPAVAFTAHTLDDAVVFKYGAVRMRAILAASVGVPNQPFRGFSAP